MTTKTHKILQSMGIEELKRLAREKKNSRAQLTKANPTSDNNRKIFPLTDAQKSIWALEQYQKGNKAYNNPLAVTCHIDHEFSPDRLQDTLNEAIATIYFELRSVLLTTSRANMLMTK